MRGLFRRLSVSLYREYRCERLNKGNKKSERMNQGWPRGSRGEKQQGRKYLNFRFREEISWIGGQFKLSDSREWEITDTDKGVSAGDKELLLLCV